MSTGDAPKGSGGDAAARASRRVSLEDFLLGCQKSLGRAVYTSEEASKSEAEFSRGERHFYGIQGLSVDRGNGAPGAFTSDDKKDGPSMRKLLAVLCLFVLFLTAGCVTRLQDDTMANPGYYWRHAKKVMSDFHEFRIDFDRTVFGLEDAPLEEW